MYKGEAEKMRNRVKRVIAGKPHVRIGKNGLTEGVIKEIERLLKNENVIKVRVMRSLKKSGINISELAKEVAEKVNAELIDVRGNVFVLLRKRRPGNK